MSYQAKTDWKYNETPTENDANRWEQGIKDAHDSLENIESTAEATSIADAEGLFESDNVEGALAETGRKVKTHLADNANPHAVTKAQVGLPLTPNGAMATEAQALAGTSNAEFMSPLRVKQALSQAGGNFSKQIFTVNGTFTAPKAGVYKVTVTGGGGSGGNKGGVSYAIATGGGAGGTSIKYVTLTKGQTVPVTVGKGGAVALLVPNDNRPVNGKPGSTSSFGSHCSATGGNGGGYQDSNSGTGNFQNGALGGEGLNGDINSRGGQSESAGNSTYYSKALSLGGASFWGGPVANNYQNQYKRTYGAGAEGLAFNSTAPDNRYDYSGVEGVVVVEWV